MRGSSGRAFRKSLKVIEKYHNQVVDKVYENPALLNDLGFDSAKIIFKSKEPPSLIKDGRKVDLLFLFDLGRIYEILLIEEAVGLRHQSDHLDQLKRAQTDFKYHWREWFKEIKEKEKIDFGKKKDVFVTTLFLNWDPILCDIKGGVGSIKTRKLGKLDV